MSGVNTKTFPRIPFSAERAATEFNAALVVAVRKQVDGLVLNVLAEENIQTFYHGQGWIDQGEDEPSMMGTFQISQVEHLINVKDLANGDLSLLPSFIESMAQSLHDNIMKLLYARVMEAVDRTGNSVSAEEAGSTAAAFLEMLRKLEFSVDNQGNVSLPQIHIRPENVAKFQSELDSQGRAFKLEAEVIKAQKIAAALKRERDRLAKFKGFNEVK